MRQLDILIISFCVLSTLVMIVAFLYWVVLFSQYKEAAKRLKTLDNYDFPSELGKVSATATRADKNTEALSESLSQLNAKLTARWRREAKAEKQNLNEEVQLDYSQPNAVPFQNQEPTNRRQRLKSLYGK